MRRFPGAFCLCAILLVSACGDPPNKEMDQAQGAIDAARAAGAEQFAATEFAAAVDALMRARTAVTERDYRLALNDALESRERAQNAAREAADTRVRLRGDAERAHSEVAGLAAKVKRALAAPGLARTPKRVLEAHQTALAAVETALQKAGEAIATDQYDAAMTGLSEAKTQVTALTQDIDELAASQVVRRRR